MRSLSGGTQHDLSRAALCVLRRDSHPGCFVCGLANGHGLGLEFRLDEEGAVEATFACPGVFEGYPATLHGGVICALLDGAMTNCLFAHGHAGVTAELRVRFRHPVITERPAKVRAWIASSLRPLHELAAELVQEEQVRATARGKFLEKGAPSLFGDGKTER
ncbi:MAG TPA: PaaI family thioesterase [Candidatus Anammoximicrobium sp.]|nr:PaaI family thioesterase [Candidatus Anammoximicrobium sp.]